MELEAFLELTSWCCIKVHALAAWICLPHAKAVKLGVEVLA